MSAIELRGAAKAFGSTGVLADVDLSVSAGSFTAVLGASGSGKTTLLRLIAGLERLDRGTLSIGGRLCDNGRSAVSTRSRGIGYVPQEGALFPHLTVRGNVAFGLPRRHRGHADELLELTGLGDLRSRYPHQLSGGQQGRVALARALAIEPRVVLLDEPFSALDAALRDGLRRDVTAILRSAGTTALFVTHDQDEALAVADQVVLLAAGRVRAVGDPRSLYRDPPDAASAVAVGEANLLDAVIQHGRAVCLLGTIAVRAPLGDPPQGECRVMVRPEQLVIHLSSVPGAAEARLVELEFHGRDGSARLELGGTLVTARVPGECALAAGDRAWIEVVGEAVAWPPSANP